MIDAIVEQYGLVKNTRFQVLNFIETEVRGDIDIPVPEFNNKTIKWMLVHIANTYLSWSRRFAFNTTVAFYNAEDVPGLWAIRTIFSEMDLLMIKFFIEFEITLFEPIKGEASNGRVVNSSALELYTHVITHEFHHKGQIMSMCRLLGHEPADTDIIRFD